MLSRKVKALFAVLCLAASLAPASSAQEGITKRLRFARGSSTAAVEDAVVRGTRNRYVLGARRSDNDRAHQFARRQRRV